MRAIIFLLLILSINSAFAKVVLEVKNDTPETCSLALHGPIKENKRLTLGWFVFAPGEEAQITVDSFINDKDIYAYHDCSMVIPDNHDTKEIWVNPNFKFSDTQIEEEKENYEKVTFMQLSGPVFVIKNR